MSLAAGAEFSRPPKLDDAQTVLYEIDMLRVARERLLSPQPTWAKVDEWVYLENFLLHFRNLIEFFGKLGNDPTDLSIGRPEAIWLGRSVEKPDLDSMTRRDLWEKYDTRDNPGAISKYLHRCTTQRTHAKDWRVHEMFEELRPVIEKFESLLPEFKPATGFTGTGGTARVSTAESSSTATTRILGPLF